MQRLGGRRHELLVRPYVHGGRGVGRSPPVPCKSTLSAQGAQRTSPLLWWVLSRSFYFGRVEGRQPDEPNETTQQFILPTHATAFSSPERVW